jgi:hypothetical protein
MAWIRTPLGTLRPQYGSLHPSLHPHSRLTGVQNSGTTAAGARGAQNPKREFGTLCQYSGATNLELGTDTSTPTNTAWITSPTALLGGTTCQHRYIRDGSVSTDSFKMAHEPHESRPPHGALAFLGTRASIQLPHTVHPTNGEQRSPTTAVGACGDKPAKELTGHEWIQTHSGRAAGFQRSQRPPLTQEHPLETLEAGKLTSNTPTDTAGITSSTALLGGATCQLRKLQDYSRTARIQAPHKRPRRPRHRSPSSF